MKNALVLILFWSVANAFGAVPPRGGESHGGQVVSCPGKAAVTLDFYEATLPTEAGGAPQLVDLSKMNSDDVLSLVEQRLRPSVLYGGYYEASQLLGPVTTWLESTLQLVPDSDPAFTLPPGCVLQQAAVRQDSTVYVDPSVLAELSPAQQGLLQVHEALYWVAQKDGLDSSVEVRMVIRELLLQNEDLSGLSKAVHEMGSKFFWWEEYLGNYVGAFTTPGGVQKVVNLALSFDPMIDGKELPYLLDVWTGPFPTGVPNGEPDAYPDSFDCSYSSAQCKDSDGLCSLKWAAGGRIELSCPSLGIDTVVVAGNPPAPLVP